MQRWLCGESIKFFAKNKLCRYVFKKEFSEPAAEVDEQNFV
jgi:hypothetical protein